MATSEPRVSAREAPRAYLWYVAGHEAISEPSLLTAWTALMSREEREQQARYALARDRHTHLVARALVRCCLSHHAPGIAPAEWVFSCNDHGRPAVAGPAGAPALSFNLTHTAGLVALLVAAGEVELGVDAEDISRPGKHLGHPEHFFSPIEVAALRRLPTAAARRRRFFELWTLKEAYLKARGLGLALPLDGFSFCFPAVARHESHDSHDSRATRITLSFTPGVPDDPQRWQLWQQRLGERHQLAAVIGRRGPGDVAIEICLWP